MLAMDIMAVGLFQRKAGEEKIVQVKHTAPVIELSGDKEISLEYGSKYKEAGYSATDFSGSDITSDVKVNVPEFDSSGDFRITYTIKDAEGHESKAFRVAHIFFPPQTEEGRARGLSVLMYHNVYDPLNPPLWRIDTNCITTTALEEELKYLVDENYYFPTWKCANILTVRSICRRRACA